MWISVPTPVTSSTKHIDSGSSSSPASTRQPLTGIQENRCWLIARSSPARPSMSAKSTNPRTNAAPAARQASTCLLYTSDAADEEDSVDLGGRRIIKKKKKDKQEK